MNTLDVFVQNLCGKFDNEDQIKEQELAGHVTHPKATHINGICNEKIQNIPSDFNGYFVLEESYYDQGGRKNILPHLFLFTLTNDNKVKLESFELPENISKEEFRNDNENLVMSYDELVKSQKFNPMIYNEENGVFTGESTSMFSPVTKFVLKETVENGILCVSEVFYKDDKKTFGFEDPIVYKKIKE